CGIESLNRLRNPHLMDSFTRVIRDLSVGELIQMQWERSFAITEEIYGKIIYGKTASLFGAVCETAGILFGADSRRVQSLKNFGILMGNMFQKRDDYIDYFSGVAKNGKTPYKDFYNGLYTYPVIVLRDQCNKTEKKIIQKIFSKPERTLEDTSVIENFMDYYKIEKTLQDEMNLEKLKLITFLKKFPQSPYRKLMIERIEDL
ncbi:MAG: polyprenyl synthetase family protein, partial [Leptospiraceae bacterium]|nr:polyprenyl synthetase family protein [Leptospiraceae bacterium]